MQHTQIQLRALFEYKDGRLIWKRMGKPAGSKSGIYETVTLEGKSQYAHRLIFLWHHGYLPSSIDHIDGNPRNNRIENLRGATHGQNHGNRKKPVNNTSGFKGVSWHKKSNKWCASIKVKYQQIYLGLYENPSVAAEAYASAAKKYFGEFARTV